MTRRLPIVSNTSVKEGLTERGFEIEVGVKLQLNFLMHVQIKFNLIAITY